MKGLKILVCGSRDFQNESFVHNHLHVFIEFLKNKINDVEITIVSGGARGPDTFGENFAKKYGFGLEVYPAEWDKHGKAAGYIRNKQMVDMVDIAIAYHDGISKGTLHSINLAKDKGILTIVAGTNKVKKIYNESFLEALVEKCEKKKPEL